MAPKANKLLAELAASENGASSSGPATKKRRQLNRRDTEDKVSRNIRDHFSDLTAVDTDGTTRGGLTLRQRLSNEHRERASDGSRMSTAVFKELRAEYTSPEDPVRHLKIEKPDDPFNPDFMTALQISESSNPAKRSKAPLYAYLATCAALNQKKLVGLAQVDHWHEPQDECEHSQTHRGSLEVRRPAQPGHQLPHRSGQAATHLR